MSGSSSRAATSAASDGNYEPVQWTLKEDSCIARVVVPGCAEIFFFYEDTCVKFGIKEVAMDQNDRSGRKYIGSVDCNPKIYAAEKAEIKFVDGVLWITAPKHHQG
ncbi:PREDICTED: 14.7 kDa heat shock protein-like [Camelina sativa]|uniref:14.7 kDa heat shock protein-like n=1 Tax=Camelina sativa TaxID=90675 RepID=A0ABM0VN06_CAMSA|nr:PREDICTED: 14.7 kDa heat shock protein-like [Camelina sativa]